jgi:hypothetical protein
MISASGLAMSVTSGLTFSNALGYKDMKHNASITLEKTMRQVVLANRLGLLLWCHVFETVYQAPWGSIVSSQGILRDILHSAFMLDVLSFLQYNFNISV